MSTIAIATPARDEVKTRFAFDVVKLTVRTLAAGHRVMPLQSMGTLLAGQRVALVKDAIESGCSHILFVDSDMAFPDDALIRLLAHNAPVVAANCAKRRIPTGPTAMKFREEGDCEVYTEPWQDGTEQVDCVGTGFMLIETSVFDTLPQPWFSTPWLAERGHHMGEDMFFCMLLRKNKIPILIDHGVSQGIGHIGDFEFKMEHALAIRDAQNPPSAQPLVEVPKWH